MRRAFGFSLALCLLGAISGCAQSPTNFSQYPGFAAYYAAQPRRDTLPTLAEQALLQRYRPHFMLPQGHAGMIDFYADYIAQGELVAGDGTVLSSHVTPEILNQHRDDANVVFKHRPNNRPTHATVYGRIDRDTLAADGQPRRDLIFLTYHAVFRSSGLPAAVAGWRAALLGAVADLNDWHQLDHYTAATLVLDTSERPVALMLQQHNYLRSYLAADANLDATQRPRVDVAIRSNELYPHLAERTTRRAVRFITPDAMRYLMGFGAPPRVSGDDITDGAIDATYELQFLKPSDAFYSFAGFLGERRRLPGRDGPPGADYNIWPTLKALSTQLVTGFFRDGDREDLARFEASYERTNEMLDFVRVQAPILSRALP